MMKTFFKNVSILIIALFLSPGLALAIEKNNTTKDEFELFDELDSNVTTKASQNLKPGPKTGSDPQEIKTAKDLIKQNKKNEAIQFLWKNINKLNSEGIFFLADLQIESGEPDDAIKALNLVIAKDQKNYVALSKIGQAQLINKKENEAMESFKDSLEINPKYEPAYLGLIQIYEKKKNLYELRILYQDMTKNIGQKAYYSEKLCEINTKDQIYEPAIRDCKLAIRLNEKACEAYVNLGLSYKYIGDEALSVKNLIEATQKCPQNEYGLSTYGQYLEDKKDYLEANKIYTLCTQYHKENGQCWLGLAKTSFELKNNDQSVAAYKNACRLKRELAAASLRKTIQFFRTSKSAKDGEKFEAILEKCSL